MNFNIYFNHNNKDEQKNNDNITKNTINKIISI